MAYSCADKVRTTIGAGGLNGRVRDGTGWTPTARITNSPRPRSACLHGAPADALACTGPPGRHTKN